jgi:hypothetical protein
MRRLWRKLFRRDDFEAAEKEFGSEAETVRTDTSFIGRILVQTGVIDEELLHRAVSEQHRHSYDQRLGDQLVAAEIITPEDRDVALRLQTDLRSKGHFKRATAMATLAKACVKQSNCKAEQLTAEATHLRRKITGQGHPAISGEIGPRTVKS